MNKVIYLIAVSLLTSSCMLFRPSIKKTFERNSAEAPYDAIIVPGVPFEDSSWSNTMKMRVSWANHLYKSGIAKNIIFSGSAVYTEYRESTIMALYGEELGIPTSAIFEDRRAEHSTENVYYGYLVAKERGFQKVALATDPFQTNMVRSFIKKYDIPVDLLPVVWQTLAKLDMPTPKIDPSSARVEGTISLVEKESFIKRFRGTMGKNIVWKREDLKKKRFHRRYKHRIED
jgi:hypothetical protein